MKLKSASSYHSSHPMKAIDGHAEIIGLQWFKAFGHAVEEARRGWRGSGIFKEQDENIMKDVVKPSVWEGIWTKMLAFKRKSRELASVCEPAIGFGYGCADSSNREI